MFNTNRNFYEVLNASPNATFEELKTNYKHLILQCHPDKLLQQQQQQQQLLQHESADKLENDLNNKEFVGIAEAWNCLKDPAQRKRYDAELLLNKFHTYNNIYAHIQLREMKKCPSTDVELGEEEGMESEGNKDSSAAAAAAESSSYIYTYDCRCGGQYIVDESAEQYCRKGNSTAADGADVDDADISQNNNSPNKTAAVHNNAVAGVNGGGGGGGGGGSAGGSEGVVFSEDEEGDSDGELIVECSECSLVIILNG